MKNLPILFLLILLVACQPAPAIEAPAPTESPEQAAARLAQDVLDGIVTLCELNAEQREAIYDQMTVSRCFGNKPDSAKFEFFQL